MIKAFLLVAVVLDPPVLGRIARRLTPEPKVFQFEVDGVPVEVLRPPDDEPRPAWIFVNGAHPLRRREPLPSPLDHRRRPPVHAADVTLQLGEVPAGEGAEDLGRAAVVPLIRHE